MREYKDQIQYFRVVNGAGGDGGVEAYSQLKDGTFIGVQAKWFLDPLNTSRIGQICSSIRKAREVRSKITRYILCIPRNLTDETKKKKYTERKQWTNLLQVIQKEFPDLDLVLWDSNRLLDELQSPGAEGIFKFWFEKQEMALDNLKERFELAKHGWLNKRYVPSLHGIGIIHPGVLKQIGHPKTREDLKKQLLKAGEYLENAQYPVRNYLRRHQQDLEASGDKDLVEFLNNLKKLDRNLTLSRKDIEMLLSSAENCNSPLLLETNSTDDLLTPVFVAMKTNTKIPGGPIIRLDLENALKNFRALNISKNLTRIHTILKPHNVLILGNPGTGKTHGLENAVENRLREGNPAILIQAKNTPASSGWGAIIKQTLGLSENWAEDEIWSALEACATRNDRARALSTKKETHIQDELTRVLICVDGLDESKDREPWIERIGELNPIIEKHNRLRFCLSSRPYFLEKPDDVDLPIIELPSDGDVPASKLFDAYTSHYSVDCSQVPWVRWALTTPLALRLFCEINEGKSFHQNDEIRTTVASLLRQKIDLIDTELRGRFSNRWGKSDQVILRSLTAIAQYFLSNQTLTRRGASDLIRTAQNPDSLLDVSTCMNILDFLVDYGVINESLHLTTDLLSPSEPFYQISLTTLTDYLIAVRTVDEIVRTGSHNMPQMLRTKPAAQEMAALILMSDNDIFVGDNGLWTTDLPSYRIDTLRLLTLARVAVPKTVAYRSWVESKLRESMPSCRRTLTDLIVPVSRVEGHPLGPRLLHDTLMGFPSVASRDLVFSGPGYLPHNHGAIWEGRSENPVIHEKLVKSDKHDGLPLLFAWSLMTVEEDLRYHCCRELTSWGKKNPGEFLKLLELTYSTDDPQMKEELVRIAGGVACLLSSEEAMSLTTLACWALHEIFDEEKISGMWNIVIRHFGRIIVERAFYKGLIEKADVERARPPYSKTSNLMKLDLEAASAKYDTFGPITMDLGWYVLKTGYNGFLGGYGDSFIRCDLTQDAKELLSRHASATGLPNLTPHQFALGATMAYVQNLGWNKEDFYGEPRGDEEEEILGVDIAIMRQYSQSRYNDRSPVATFAEKYVWCSVPEIRGYLADRLPHQDGEGGNPLPTKDYGCIYNMPPSTAQESRENHNKNVWFLPNELFPEISCSIGDRQQEICTWIDKVPEPPFTPWIYPSCETLIELCDEPEISWICLYNMTSLTKRDIDVKSTLIINAFLIAENDFETFLSDCKKPGKSDVKSFSITSYNVTTSIRAQALYFTPRDVLWMDWLEEEEDVHTLSVTKDNKDTSYTIYPVVMKGIYKSKGSREIDYKLPSKKVRTLLQITGGDERRYSTKTGLQGFGSKIGDSWRESQELIFVRSEALHSVLQKQNLKIFWTINLMREPSTSAQEEFSDLYHIKDQCWVFWMENGETKSYEIVNPPKSNPCHTD